jgi:peroxiredoxin (alkyl hydroperoxide reductase subunit C)
MNACLIGKQAPYFKAKAVQQDKVLEEFSLKDYLGKYVIFFFYPLDFTFVCPTELHAFQEKLEEFEKRNAAWLSIPKQKGGVHGVTYPLVSDLNKSIATKFNVLKEDEGIAYRGLFLIDKHGIIRHQIVNDLALGRSVDEALRMVDALIFHEKEGEVCPANWVRGKKAMEPTQKGLYDYFN